jgi:hypothetical protein
MKCKQLLFIWFSGHFLHLKVEKSLYGHKYLTIIFLFFSTFYKYLCM